MTSYTNQLTLTSFYEYDALARKIAETNANWEVTQLQYSPSGDLTNLIDGKSQSTVWKYDCYGRVTNKVDNLGTSVLTYAYDANSRLTNRTSAAKGTATWRYDAAGNLTNIVYPISSNITMAYDALN